MGVPVYRLHQHNTSCRTHVHLSRPNGYSLHELKSIHFETSFEAILPEERLGNEYTKSNYMDNINFDHHCEPEQ